MDRFTINHFMYLSTLGMRRASIHFFFLNMFNFHQSDYLLIYYLSTQQSIYYYPSHIISIYQSINSICLSVSSTILCLFCVYLPIYLVYIYLQNYLVSIYLPIYRVSIYLVSIYHLTHLAINFDFSIYFRKTESQYSQNGILPLWK